MYYSMSEALHSMLVSVGSDDSCTFETKLHQFYGSLY